MKRIALALVLLPLLIGSAYAQPPWRNIRTFVIVNRAQDISEVWDDQTRADIVNAVNEALPDFAAYWFTPARLYADASVAPKHAFPVIVTDQAISARVAEGVHYNHSIIVSLRAIMSAKDTSSVSIVISHEIEESLADQFYNQNIRNSPWPIPIKMEVCDPVDGLLYRASNGQLLSDFVTPAWFKLPSIADRYDYLNAISQPFELGPNGSIDPAF